MKNKKIIRLALLILMLTTICLSNGFAQPGYDDDADVNDVPLDGGISILLIGGAAIGLKSIQRFRHLKN